MGSRARFRDVLAIGEFRALWLAELLSVVGDQLARVALSVLVYQQTGSASWTALTYALTFAPALLGGVFLSGLADRISRRELMVGVDLIRAVFAGLMVLPGLPLPVLMALVFLLTLAGAPFKAAQQALLPSVLPGERYEVGLALRTVTMQAAQLGGFLGGAMVLSLLTPRTALGLNAATFLMAAAVVAVGVRHRDVAGRTGDDGLGGGVAGAARLVWRDRRLRGLVGLSWLIGLFVVPEGLAAPYTASLGVAVSVVGLLMAADPIGGILGAWLISRVDHQARVRMLRTLAIASGIPLMACVLRPGIAVVVVLWVVSAACSTAYLIIAQALFVRQVPDARRGAATGLASTGVLTSQGLAIFAGGVLADVTSAPVAVALAGAAGVVLTTLVGASWLRAGPRERRARRHRGRREANDATAVAEVTNPCSQPSSKPPSTSVAEPGSTTVNPAIIVRAPNSAVHVVTSRSWVPWRWALWTVPRPLLLVLFLVEASTVVLTVVMASRMAPTAMDLARFGCLALLGLAVGEMTRHVERARRRFTDTPHINVTSVWTFSAALVLPPPLAAVVVILLYQQLYWRSWRRVRGVHAYRSVFTASTVILSAYAAAAICAAFGFVPTDLFQWTRWGSAGVILLAILAYTVVNAVLVALAITLSERRLDLRRSLGTTRENALEFGTLGLGALSVVPITLNLALATLLIPALLVLHRSVLMRQLEEAAFTDPHTGLTNATTWTSVATLELERAAREGRTLGILMIDIDYFKKVNDTHGHLVGDQVLRAIADTLSRSVSRHDLVARWGGEEFVMLCPDLSATELGQLGDRLCQRIRQLQVPVSLPGHLDTIEGLTVSIGAASFPDFGPDLQDILLAADDALFGAKDNGRDQIHCVTPARFPDSPRDIS